MLLQRGAQVIANHGRHRPICSRLGDAHPDSLHLVAGDVGDEQTGRSIAEQAGRLGRLDVLVHNAAITRDGALTSMPVEDFDEVVRVNLRGAFVCTKHALALMVDQRYGRVIYVSSVVALVGNAGQANYAASKAGLHGLAMSVAQEYSSHGVRTVVLAPGILDVGLGDASGRRPATVRPTTRCSGSARADPSRPPSPSSPAPRPTSSTPPSCVATAGSPSDAEPDRSTSTMSEPAVRIAVSGSYGSGKTTTAEALAIATGIPRTDALTARELIVDLLPGKRFQELAATELYTLALRRFEERVQGEAEQPGSRISDGSVLHEWVYGEARMRVGINPGAPLAHRVAKRVVGLRAKPSFAMEHGPVWGRHEGPSEALV